MKSGKTAILFDFDGVLVDSLPSHLLAWKNAYEQLFQQELPRDQLHQQIGKSTRFIAKELAFYGRKPLLAEKLAELKSSLVLKQSSGVPLLPGAREIVVSLRSHEVPFGIVSNASRGFIGSILDFHDLSVPFYLGIEDYRRPKPDPEPYLMGAKKLGYEFIDHDQVIVFEDSVHGIKAANFAKMTTVGVASQHSQEHLLQAGAAFTCRNLLDFIQAEFDVNQL